MKAGTGIFIFLSGLITGAVSSFLITKLILDKKYNRDIEGVVKVFKEKEDALDKKYSEQQNDILEPESEQEVKVVVAEEEIANDYRSDEEKATDEYNELHDIPFEITEKEYGTIQSYEMSVLLYYADGVMTEEKNTYPLSKDDINELIGNNLYRLAKSRDDRMFVRCPSRETDYEIIFKDEGFYEDDS